jgi:hypothetical protein
VIRPWTCVCLILAAGSGLYLYQVKQRAFALDASLRSTFHDIDVARERTRMLRADWALVNDPERLQALASQYLTLQPMQPSQLLTMDQLAAALPPPVPFRDNPAPVAKPAPAATPAPAPASAIDPTHGLPMAEAAPQVLPHTQPAAPVVALLQPAAPDHPLPPQPFAPKPFAPEPAPQQAAAPQAAPGPSPALAIAAAPLPPLPAAPMPAPVPQPPVFASAAPAPHFTAATIPPPKSSHRLARHSGAEAQPWLAEGNGYEAASRRHAGHHATPQAAPAPRQFYAANMPSRMADPVPRITPPAATVMYRPVSGSSLGMASSATLAPPRPLYSTSQ